MITLKAARNDGKQPDIKERDKNKPLRNSVPELAKSATHSHFHQVRPHGTSVTEHHSSCSKSRDNLPEGESLARGAREIGPGPHLPLPQPPECSGSPGELVLNMEPGAGGPWPWRFGSKMSRSSGQHFAFPRGLSHCDGDSESHFQKHC